MRRQLLAFVLLIAQLAVGAVVQAQTLSHVRITPPSVPAGGSALVYVTLTETATADALVRIAQAGSGFTSPNKLTIAKGRKFAAFTVRTQQSVFGGANLWFQAPGNTIKKTIDLDWNRDVALDVVERVSAGPAYEAGNAPSDEPEDQPAGDRRPISSDGQRVVFSSRATNLVAGDTNRKSDVFLRDAIQGRTIRLSNGLNGKPANGRSFHPSISADGTYAVFVSEATNLVPNDTNSAADVFLVRISDLSTTRVSVTPFALEGSDDSGQPSINADGSFVAFASYASNLVLDDTNGFADVFIWSRVGGNINRVSVSRTGADANGDSYAPSIGRDGTMVSFTSTATNLTVNDLNELPDIFLRDRTLKTNTLVSVDDKGLPLQSECTTSALADNGNRIAFMATEPLPPYGFAGNQVRYFDRAIKKTTKLALASDQRAFQSFALSETGRYLCAVEVQKVGWTVPDPGWEPEGYPRVYDLDFCALIGLPLSLGPREILREYNFRKVADMGISASGDWIVHSSTESFDDADRRLFADVAVSKSIYPVAHFGFPTSPLLPGESSIGKVILNQVAPAGGTEVAIFSYDWTDENRTVVVPAGERVAPFPFTVRESATTGILVSAVTDGRLRETFAGVVPHRAYSDNRTYPKDTKYVRVWVEVLAPTTTDRTFTVRADPPLSVPPKVVMKAGQKRVSFVVTIGANAVGDKQLLVDNAKNQSTRVYFTLLP